MTRLLRTIVALFLCTACGAGAAEAPRSARPQPSVPAACASLDLFVASDAMRAERHPCRAWIDVTYGRVVATGVAFSGTVVSTTTRRGAGLFVTCQHCAGPGQEALVDPESDPPRALRIGEPPRFSGDKILGTTDGRTSRFYLAHRLLAPVPPASAFDERGSLSQIFPRDDFVVSTISGRLVRVYGHLYPLPAREVDDGPLPLHDPRGLAAAAVPFADARPGDSLLLLGYPRDLPDRAFRGELVASVGEVLDDDAARDMLSRSDPEEAAIPYAPEVEYIVTARAVSGMSGGGAFDRDGRWVGVLVRGTLQSVDGKYLTRVVRASHVAARIAATLAEAPPALGERVRPFLP